ncbi:MULTISPECIES: hypothetical protein [Mycolicibacterium]|uniref:Keratin associated protein n=2 Tax=Mycolicibacterium TaxID=1866885 RepID=A0A2U9PX85_MYCSE|nr:MULTISPECIES: hypothetical protein [Mycolicibacterium]AWT56420.1 hypothetical protein D806_054730 [Mycolicibacterium smegmatis MKD8]OKH65074.1 hypothetical protein EB74_07670 [Mycobacterium sp. SWH-M5]ULN46694.1 hypothetical protein MI170_25965 [Mycolicibacterium goodii]
MTNTVRCLAAVAAATCMALLAAPVSAAAPQCTNVSPNTTQCQTNGSTQIVTSPPAINYGPWYGWGFGLGGIAIGW